MNSYDTVMGWLTNIQYPWTLDHCERSTVREREREAVMEKEEIGDV